jgi:O-antigen biosynthesis protein
MLSIIIPVFNKWNFTKTCLNDLTKLSEKHEIIIINNASSDETFAELYKYCAEHFGKNPKGPHIYSAHNTENTFHSKACNQGYKMATGEYVLFLNNDIRVKNNHENWTQAFIEAADNSGGLVGPTMGQLDNQLNFVKEANAQLEGNSYLGGWCLGAKRETWEKLRIGETHQIWNEEFPFYFNDTDLSFRARQKKIPITFVSSTDIVHFGKVSAAQINIPKLYNEGRQVFLKKWGKK